MKIAFDQNMPPVLVEVFTTLAKAKFIIKSEFIHAGKYVKQGDPANDDSPWMQRFAEDGGHVVFTGDKGIRSVPHQRKAYRDAGLMVFCFSSQWGTKKQFSRAAHLIYWWPYIEKHYLSSVEPKHCWEIPYQFSWKELRDVTGPDEIEDDAVLTAEVS